jgi:hypothetical protein
MIARRNPSRMQRIEDELVFDPAWLGDSWEAFVARLQAQAWRGQIIGPHGSGNSACLRRLEHHLRDHGMSLALSSSMKMPIDPQPNGSVRSWRPRTLTTSY